MTTLGERLRIARERKGLTQIQVKEKTNINNKTLSGYENNVSEPDTRTLVALAELYEVSYKWLLTGEGKIDNESSDWDSKLPDLTEKDERDIAEELEKIINDLSNNAYSAYGGVTPDEIDEEDRELLIASIENSLRLAKRIAKQKFTPKKYRK